MTPGTSNWIPRKRIRIAITIAIAFTVLAVVGSVLTRASWVLLLPALGAGWAAFVMMRIRRQLSDNGGGWQRRIHELVVDRLGLAPESTATVLDIGCGDGSLLIALLDRSPDVGATGVDHWGDNWDYAQDVCADHLVRHGHRASLQRMDAAGLEFADDTFDIVVSVMCFHEVRGSTGPVGAVREALRVLRPGGAFVLIDRFADVAAYGDGPELQETLDAAACVKREPIRELLDLPWPLSSKRALGPVEVLSGRR